MPYIRIAIMLTLFTCSLLSVSQEANQVELFKDESFTFPYRVNQPDKIWKLPKNLDEISGLGYIDKYRLACIQDEKGNMYIFNMFTGEIERKIDFAEDGDFEAIEIVKDDAWILKSNGTLYKVKNYLDANKNDVKKYPTILTKKNDVEGMCYDPSSKQLLIVCKGHPFVDDKSGKNLKAIYQFNPRTHLLDMEPFLLVHLDIIKKLRKYNTLTKWGIELLAYFDDSKGDLTFQPSALAIHPITHDIYILGAVGNLLMVYSPDKEVQAIVRLNPGIHPQPEGICFSPDGTLYISSEGKDKKGRICVFNTN